MATLFGGKEHVPFFRHSWDELHAFVAETEIKGNAFVDLRISGTLGVTLLMANISVVVRPLDSGQVRSVCTGNVHTIQLMDMHDYRMCIEGRKLLDAGTPMFKTRRTFPQRESNMFGRPTGRVRVPSYWWILIQGLKSWNECAKAR